MKAETKAWSILLSMVIGAGFLLGLAGWLTD